MRTASGPIGSSTPQATVVSVGSSGTSQCAVRRLLSQSVSSSGWCAPLQSTTAHRPPRTNRSAFLGVAFPSSRHQPTASLSASGFQSRHVSVLGVSHALDGLLRHRPCRFVSPRCHVQGSPFRDSPPTQPHHLVGGRSPLDVGFASLPPVARRRHDSLPHPQGFAPCGSPWSARRCLAIPRTRFPPGCSTSSRYDTPRGGNAFTFPSAHGLR